MIHTYSLFGYNVALDINSGAVHLLDEISFELLKRAVPPLTSVCPANIAAGLTQYTQEEIKEAWDELYNLCKEGLLFSDDEYLNSSREMPKDTPLKALCLHVSHDCNLRCGYCFASTGDFGTGRRIMEPDVAQKAVLFVTERSGARRNIEIDFFGGEPLMAMDTVKKTVEFAKNLNRNKNFRFTITTNGLLLNEQNIDYINENMDNAVLSLDGRENINDAIRKTIDGGGSYSIIVPKFKKLIEGRKNKDYYLRGTFTKDNLDFTNDVLHIAGEGFRHISVEPVSSTGPYAIRESDLPRIFSEYEKLARIIMDGANFDFFHFNVDLTQGPCAVKRLRGCGAGYEYAAVTPEGDIYPCHQFVGIEKFKMGSVLDGSFDKNISEEFKSKNIYTRTACLNCWAKFYCSGGCGASNYLSSGNLDTPDNTACEMERKRLECAIIIAIHKIAQKNQ